MGLVTEQLTISSERRRILGRDLSRISALIVNQGSTNVYIGGPTLTTSSGFLLPPDSFLRAEDRDEVFAVTVAGTSGTLHIAVLTNVT